MSDDEKDEGIYKVDTVPPPAGEGDAYNAPTRVGPMGAAVVEEMMHAAERKATELIQAAEEKKVSARQGRAASQPAPSSSRSSKGSFGPATQAGSPPKPGPPSKPGSLSKPGGAGVKAGPAAKAAASSSTSSAEASQSQAAASHPPEPDSVPYALADKDLIEEDDGAPPRIYDESDDEDNAATVLSKAAKAPSAQPVAHAPLTPTIPAPAGAAAPKPAFPAPPMIPVVAGAEGADAARAADGAAVTAPVSPDQPRQSTPPNSYAPRTGPSSPIPFALHSTQSAEPHSLSFPPPFGSTGPADNPAFLERPFAVYVALVVGFTLFFVGVGVYLWAR
jgi:hypothetical protein